MFKFILIISILLLAGLEAFAANPAIIFGSGGLAKTIPTTGIELSNGVQWRQLGVDPSAVATDAPEGSFGSFGANVYIKKDNGATTNWEIVSSGVGYTSPITTEGDLFIGGALGVDARLPIGLADYVLTSDGTTLGWAAIPTQLPVFGKGSILTSDGVVNGEFTACADGEFLEWDAAETAGVKCTQIVLSPTTTQGDIIFRGAVTDDRLAIGTENQLLTVQSGEPAWADAPVSTTLTAKGEIQGHDGTDNVAIPAPTQNGQFLESDDTEDSGWKVSNSILANIGQAQFVGEMEFANNCVWQRSAVGYGYVTDATCSPSNTIGNITQPTDTTRAGIKITNFRTDGYYKFTYQGILYNGNDTGVCTFATSKDGSTFSGGEVYVGASSIGSREQGQIISNIKFSSSDTGEIFIIADPIGGANCSIFGQVNDTGAISVHFFPDSNSLAAIQNTELTAATANKLTAFMTGTSPPSILTDNYKMPDGTTPWLTCVRNSTGNYTCTFALGLFTSTPVCHVHQNHPSTVQMGVNIESQSNTAINFEVYDANSVFNPDAFNITCNKTGVDVNKSQVIAGTFENINSTDLVKVKASATASLTLVNNSFTNLNYNSEEQDNYNALSGTTFTAPRASNYMVCSYIRTQGNSWGLGTLIEMEFFRSIQSNKSIHREERDNTNTHSDQYGDCLEVSLLESEQLIVRFFHNRGSDLDIDPSATYNHLTITEIPDYEAIVKQLSNRTRECTKKLLVSDVSSTGVFETFSNLVVGKKYSINANYECQEVSASNVSSNLCILRAVNGAGGTVCYDDNSLITNGIVIFQRRGAVRCNDYFVAGDTTLDIQLDGLSNSKLDGATFNSQKYVELCEENDDLILNSTKFN